MEFDILYRASRGAFCVTDLSSRNVVLNMKQRGLIFVREPEPTDPPVPDFGCRTPHITGLTDRGELFLDAFNQIYGL